jgi:MFS family permease
MRRLFPLVAAVIMLDTMFYAAITPLLPEYADDLDLSKTAAGVLTASYAAGTLIAALPSGFLAARIGSRQAMLVGLALIAVSSVAFAFAESVAVLDVARFAEGVGGACAWTGGLTWLMTAASAERRGEIIGAALAAAIFGILLGPVLGGIATVTGPEVVFCAVAALAAGLGLRVFTTPGLPAPGAPPVRRVVAAIATRPVLFAGWLVALPAILSGTFNVLVPLRMDELGATGLAIGAAFLIAAGIEAFTAPVIGRLSDRRGRGTPIRAGLLAAAICALVLPVPESAVLVAVALVAVVLAMSLIWTPAMALLSDNAEGAGLDLAFASAMVSFAWAAGQVAGGSGFGGIADATSDAAAYGLVAALLATTLAAYGGLDRLTRAAVASPERLNA